MRNPTLFSRIFNTPLMIQPAKLDAILAGIGPRFGMDIPLTPEAALTAQGEHRLPGYQVIGGVAHIEIVGVLAHRGGLDANSSYILGYDRIGQLFQAAMTDKAVRSILLEIDSPGGEVHGAFELASAIRAGGKAKPVNAVISSMATSAGYLIASAASDIAISETGLAGSIGVFLRHVDVSKMADKEGFKVTYVFAGGHKVDGNPYQPLPETVKNDLQGQIDKVYGLFVNTVAEYRGLNPSVVKAQEARVYTGQDAIKSGLADRIATPDEILGQMQGGVYKSDNPNNATLTAQQAKLEADMGWEKAITSVNNPPPVGIAPISVNGRSAGFSQTVHDDSPNQTTGTESPAQAEAVGSWDHAIEKANADFRARHGNINANTAPATQADGQSESAKGWEKAVQETNAQIRAGNWAR